MGKVIEDCSLAEVIGQLKEGHKARGEYEELLNRRTASREFEGGAYVDAALVILKRARRPMTIGILWHEMIRGGMYWDHSINSVELALMERGDLFKYTTSGVWLLKESGD